MENPDNLLLFPDMLLSGFIRFTHLVPALNAFNNIDIVFATHRQRILRLTGRTNRPGYKSFSHCRTSLLLKLIPAIKLPSLLLHFALENFFQFAARFPHTGNLRSIGMDRH